MDEKELNLQVLPKSAYEISVSLSEIFDELPEEAENLSLIFDVMLSESDGLEYIMEIYAHIEDCGISFLQAVGEIRTIPETMDTDVMEAFIEFLNSDAFDPENVAAMLEAALNMEEE